MLFAIGGVIGICIGWAGCALLSRNTLVELIETKEKYDYIVKYAREHNGIIHAALYSEEDKK